MEINNNNYVGQIKKYISSENNKYIQATTYNYV